LASIVPIEITSSWIIASEKSGFKIIRLGVGDISESDLNFAQADKNVLIVGFNVKVERTALDANDQIGATIKTFNIIYELTDWLKQELEEKRPRVEEKTVSGSIKVLKIFGQTKNRLVFGGRVVTGSIKVGNLVDILRRENKIGVGKIVILHKGEVFPRGHGREVQGREGQDFSVKMD
jgi:translation initiation factor IF-2